MPGEKSIRSHHLGVAGAVSGPTPSAAIASNDSAALATFAPLFQPLRPGHAIQLSIGYPSERD